MPLLGIAALSTSARADILYASTESDANRISRVSPAGVVSPFANLSPGAFFPQSLAFDSGNNLFAVRNSAHDISRITPAGAVSSFKVLPDSSFPVALAIDAANNLYTGDVQTRQIVRITPGGTASVYASLPSTDLVTGLAFDRNGVLYAADSEAGVIRRVTPGGGVSTFATLRAGALPFGLAFAADGNLFVSDPLNGVIDKVTPAGVVSLFATLPDESQPLGLAFDRAGFLYAGGVDQQIRRISPGGVIMPFAVETDTVIGLAFTDDAGNRLTLPVPEPASAALLVGMSAMMTRRRRQTKSAVSWGGHRPPRSPFWQLMVGSAHPTKLRKALAADCVYRSHGGADA